MDASVRKQISGKAALSRVLKELRRHRQLRVASVAAAMGMKQRSYEHFESGAGRINRARIHQFAEVMEVDAFAIFAALDIGSPRFALRCADNKFMMILMMALLAFDAAVGDEIQRLETTQVIEAFTLCFDGLKKQACAADEIAEQWMADKVLPKPRED